MEEDREFIASCEGETGAGGVISAPPILVKAISILLKEKDGQTFVSYDLNLYKK
jgi:hypothetical protein